MCCSILLSRQKCSIYSKLPDNDKGGIDHCDLLGGYLPYHAYSLSRAEKGAGSICFVTWVTILSCVCVYIISTAEICVGLKTSDIESICS